MTGSMQSTAILILLTVWLLDCLQHMLWHTKLSQIVTVQETCRAAVLDCVVLESAGYCLPQTHIE